MELFLNGIKAKNLLINVDPNPISETTYPIYRAIKSANSNLIMLIAHSTNKGNNIISPYGRILSEELYRYCAKLKKICVVITCHSQDFSFNRNISIDEAREIYTAVDKEFSNPTILRNRTFEDVHSKVIDTLKGTDRKMRLKVRIMLDGFRGLIIIYGENNDHS